MLVLLLPPPNTRRAVAPLRIRVAPLLALLLRRAVRVEVVELATREQLGAGPLAVRFLNGSLDALSFGEIAPLNRHAPLALQ